MTEATAQTARLEHSGQDSGRILRLVGTLGGVFLGAILLLAVWGKAVVPSAFAEEIDSRGLGLLIGPAAVAYLALALEAGLGMLLLTGVRRLWVLVPAAALVVFFLFLTGQDYVRSLMGLETGTSCGCFGNLVERSPAEAFWQDLALMVPALVLAFLGGRERRERVMPPVRTAVAAAAALGVVLLAWKAPELPLDDWATRLRPGVEVAAICAGEGSERVCLDTVVPGLEEGRHLVILAELSEPFGESVERINRYVDHRTMTGADEPPLHVVVTAEHAERQAFFWQWAPAFEPLQGPESLLGPLYRTLPRSFAVAEGEVIETWSGLPPFERWLPGSTEAPRSDTP